MPDEAQQRVSPATREADRADAKAKAGAPQVPTAAESEAADRHGPAAESTGEHYEEMVEKGADAKGEGRLP